MSKLRKLQNGTSHQNAADESRLDRAIRQMIAVETGMGGKPESESVSVVDNPDIGGIRRSLGLTQEAMAHTLQIPLGTLRNWEQDRRTPTNAGKLVLRLLSQVDAFSADGDSAPESRGINEESKILGKARLAAAVAETAGLSVAEARSAIDATLDAIVGQLKRGGSVRLPGFGSFTVSKRDDVTGVNLQTGEVIGMAGKASPKFVAGKALKEAIN